MAKSVVSVVSAASLSASFWSTSAWTTAMAASASASFPSTSAWIAASAALALVTSVARSVLELNASNWDCNDASVVSLSVSFLSTSAWTAASAAFALVNSVAKSVISVVSAASLSVSFWSTSACSLAMLEINWGLSPDSFAYSEYGTLNNLLSVFIVSPLLSEMETSML